MCSKNEGCLADVEIHIYRDKTPKLHGLRHANEEALEKVYEK